MTWPNPDRVRLALNGPSGEVLRLIALQPKKPSSRPPDGEAIPVPRR